MTRKSKENQSDKELDVAEAVIEDTIVDAPEDDIMADFVEEDSTDVANDEAPEFDYDSEDHQGAAGSFSSKVLTGLVLLAVGGGAALWGGPKLAPMLPQGLSPVAEFLSPSKDAATQQVGALEAKIEDRFTVLEDADTNALTQDAINAALADYDIQNQININALSDQLNAADGSEIESRLASVETRLEGLAASLDSLNTQLTGQITEGTENMSAETIAQLGVFQATVQGLKAELKALSEKQGSLDQKIDDVEVSAKRKIDEAETKVAEMEVTSQATLASAETTALLGKIAAALESGSPFDVDLGALTDTPPAALSALANEGAPSLASLQKSFADYAHTALRASDKAAAGDGTVSKFSSFLKAQVGTRSLTPQDGDSTDAILSRVDAAAKNGDLATALTETKSLDTSAMSAMAPWITQVQSLEDAKAALSLLTSSLSGQ